MPIQSKTIIWQEVKKKIENEPWAAAVAESVKLGFEGFCREWEGSPPTEPSAWYHHYFCEDCAVMLRVEFDKPYAHQCPACGRTYTGELVDGSWRKLVHCSIMLNLERAAILANLFPDEVIYRKYLKENVLFYTENYTKYEVHGKNVGKGRVFPQNLTEAIFVIEMERILRMVGEIDLFSKTELEKMGENFFRPAADLIRPQIYMIHNIHSWMNGALAAAAHFLGDRELMDFAINGEFGWRNQLQKGVTEEGLWFEISPGYHFYTVQALLSLAWIAREEDIDLFTVPKFEKMFRIPLELTYVTGELPAYNDTKYAYCIGEVAGLYEEFSSVCPEAADFLSIIYSQKNEFTCKPLCRLPFTFPNPAVASYPRSSVSALLFGPQKLTQTGRIPQIYGSRIFKETGIGILENENVRVGLKFTNASGWHDHYDKLAIDVFALGEQISADFGTSGYGIEFTDKWNRTSVAHNMVVIDGKRQEPCNAELLAWNENNISVQTDKAYPGVLLRRSLQLKTDGFSDRFEVDSENEAVIDWVFHCKGEINVKPGDGDKQVYKDIPCFSEGNGYDMLTNLRLLETNENWSLEWKMPGGTLKLDFEGVKGTRVFTGQCYGQNGLNRLGIVIVRRRAVKTAFQSQFTVRKA